MKISVKVKTGSKTESVKKVGAEFIVSVRARAEGGRANEAVIEALAEHFDIPKTSLRIISGHKSRIKIVERI